MRSRYLALISYLLHCSKFFIKMHRFFWIAVILLALIAPSYNITRYIKVGAIFHKGDEDHISAFLKAITDTRQEQLAPAFELLPVIKYIDADTDSFKTGLATCKLLQEGVAAIFGPSSIRTRGIVASIAARYDIPHIEYVWRDNERLRANKNPPTLINVFPDNELVSQAIADIVESMQWQNFAVIYENKDGLSRLLKILTKKRSRYPITIRQLGEGPDYRSIFNEIRSLPVCNVIIDVSPHKLIHVLNQAKEVKLLGDYCHFIITYMDTSKLSIFEVQNGTTANITGLSLRENDVKGINLFDSAILYDAVFLFEKALTALISRNINNEESLVIDPVPLSCEERKKYQAGPNITNIMREISKTGKITGVMNFDDDGRRNFTIHIMDFRQPNVTRIAYWNTAGVHHVYTDREEELESYLYKWVQEKTFMITTKVSAPYVMEVTDGSTRGILFNEKRYEGYCIDLINLIAFHLRFKYEFELVKDNKYGSYNEETKTWDGLIGRLLNRDADLAISDLTISSDRESVADFSLPFMNLGISILVSKSEDKNTNLFYFLFPLSADVWIYMTIAYFAVSIMLLLQARMAPGEWNNPHPCNSDPEKLENNFSLKNSLWLIIASLMRQGSNILPKAPSVRMLVTIWWFFILIMISSYTAFLATLFTIKKMETIKGIEDLARQTKIKYGTLKWGATADFFRNSELPAHKRMWATMDDWGQSAFTSSIDEGVERVIKGKGRYAFLMESTAIEYRIERNCDLDKIGSLIINKGYGIAMPRNSPYRELINETILYLKQIGILAALKKKWWQEIGGELCINDDADKNANSAKLGMANVGGVFLLLMCGCAATLVIAVCEFFWNVREVAVREKITPKEALIAELKFAVNIWAKTKPVKIAKSSSSASSVEDGNGRAASTTR